MPCELQPLRRTEAQQPAAGTQEEILAAPTYKVSVDAADDESPLPDFSEEERERERVERERQARTRNKQPSPLNEDK